MKILCDVAQLKSVYDISMRAVPNRSTTDILMNVLMRAENGKIHLYSHDYENGIIAELEGDVIEEGSILLPAQLTKNILSSLPDEAVSIYTTKEGIEIESGKRHFKVPSKDADHFPEAMLISDDEKEGVLTLSQKTLYQLINKTIYAASKDQIRQIFNSLFFNLHENKIEVVGIDGYRLALAKKDLSEEKFEENDASQNKDMKIVIPTKVLHIIYSIIDKNGENKWIRISHNKQRVMFETKTMKLVSPLIDGSYIDYEKLLPQEEIRSEMIIQRDAFLESLLPSQFIHDKMNGLQPVSFKSEGSHHFTVNIGNKGNTSYQDTLSIELKGEDIDADFNPNYFIQTLRSISEDFVRVSFNGPEGPSLVKPIEGDDYIDLILPIRR